MNIFQVIRQATSRTEPFHSRYLACALQESANSERSLFEAVWMRVAPSEWEVPEHPKITAEEQLETGAIDIVIFSNDQRNRIVGIEVKTVEASTETGQLQKYLAGLKEKYSGKDIAIAYLTPFNRERVEQMSEGAADVSLPTIKEFKEFSQTFNRAYHVSWLDVADIAWDGNALWQQHREYVREHMATLREMQRNRILDVFFGEDPARRFMEALERLGVSPGESGVDINIDLTKYANRLPWLAQGLAEALGTLVREGDGVSLNLRKPKQNKFENWRMFRESPFSAVHQALFGLADSNPHVWVTGKRNYGVRVVHKQYASGVSLIRSNCPTGLRISGRR